MPPRERLHVNQVYTYDDDGISETSSTDILVDPLTKCVRFSQDPADVFFVDNRREYSNDEKSKIWYRKKDYHRFKESCRRIVDWISHRGDFAFAMPTSIDENDSLFCARGLERYTREGTTRFLERRESFANEMYVLKVTGAAPELLANLAAAHAAPCVVEAHERARQDEESSKRYLVHHSRRQTSMLPVPRMHVDQRGSRISRKETCRLLRQESTDRLSFER